ncbi:hypothetical protein EMMF5_002164 [Cystobasidiomycetes sp. EMM_F5]
MPSTASTLLKLAEDVKVAKAATLAVQKQQKGDAKEVEAQRLAVLSIAQCRQLLVRVDGAGGLDAEEAP